MSVEGPRKDESVPTVDLERLSVLQRELEGLKDWLTAARSKRDAEIVRLVEQVGYSRYRIAKYLAMSESAIKKIVDANPGFVIEEAHTMRTSPQSRATLETSIRSGRIRRDPEPTAE